MKKVLLIFLLFPLFLSTKAQLNINYYMTVGQTRTQIGNYTGAIEYFNIVIKFKPQLPEPYFYRGVAKHRLEDYRGAILDYNQAIRIKPRPHNVSTWVTLLRARLTTHPSIMRAITARKFQRYASTPMATPFRIYRIMRCRCHRAGRPRSRSSWCGWPSVASFFPTFIGSVF